jgi:hypothetical protein
MSLNTSCNEINPHTTTAHNIPIRSINKNIFSILGGGFLIGIISGLAMGILFGPLAGLLGFLCGALAGSSLTYAFIIRREKNEEQDQSKLRTDPLPFKYDDKSNLNPDDQKTFERLRAVSERLDKLNERIRK